jgi:hypothetical protein
MSYWGLLKRKQALVLSWPGRLLFLVVLIAALFLIARNVHPFLAITRPTYGEILIVEGWLRDTVLQRAVSIFNTYDYQLIVTTGGPLTRGSYLSEYASSAELTAATLRKLGVDPSLIVSVPAPPVRTDRTYASAVAVHDWLSQSNTPVTSVDVFSLDAHARRTWWLFRLALGNDIPVGVISAPHPEYDAGRWWASSSGVRTIIGEAIAYLYARFVFNPPQRDPAPSDALGQKNVSPSARIPVDPVFPVRHDGAQAALTLALRAEQDLLRSGAYFSPAVTTRG